MAKNKGAASNGSFRDAVDRSLSGLELQSALRERIRSSARQSAAQESAAQNAPARRGGAQNAALPFPAKKGGGRRFARRSTAAAAIAACLAAVLCLGAAAAAFLDFGWFLGRMGGDLRELVSPVGAFTVQNGIRMDVLAAVNDGDLAIIYLALTDEEQRRIDENTELYNLEAGDGSFVWGPRVDFDPITGTAVYRLEVYSGEREGAPASGTFSLVLRSVLTGVSYRPPRNTGLTVADVVQANPEPRTLPAARNAHGHADYMLDWGANPAAAEAMAAQYEAGALPLLVPGSAPMQTQWPYWSALDAAGVIDGALHLRHSPAGELGAYAVTAYSLAWGTGADAAPGVSASAAAEAAAPAASTPRPAAEAGGETYAAAQAPAEEAAAPAAAAQAAPPLADAAPKSELYAAPQVPAEEAARAPAETGQAAAPFNAAPQAPALSRMRLELGPRRQEGLHSLSAACEDVLELPRGVPLGNIRIQASGTTCEGYISGEWRVELALDENPEELFAEPHIDMNGWTLERLSVTAVGVKASGSGKMGPDSTPAELAVFLKDGSLVHSESAAAYADAAGAVTLRSCFARPINLAQVAKVTLNGVEYPLS